MKEETKKNYTFHDTVISWALIIWAVASIGLMFYFSGMNQVTFATMTLGQLFLIMGVIAVVKNQPTDLVFIATGLGCIIIPAINEWGGLFNSHFESNNIFPIMSSVAVTLIGICMMIVPGILENMAQRRCKTKVKAECVDFKAANLKDGSTVYAPVYSYSINGKDYVKCIEKYSKNKVPLVGEKVELNINEKNPEDVYIEASKASKMLIYIFGFCFFITGIGMVLTVLAEI